MVPRMRTATASLLLLSTFAVAVAAVDQPIDGKRLKVRDHGVPGKAVLTFVASDPGMLVPLGGSANDPSLSASLAIEIHTGSDTKQLLIPTGLGSPGWKVRQGRRTSYVYQGSSSGNDDLVKIALREGGRLKLRVRGLDLGDAPPFGAVAIRVVSGSLRHCSVFAGGSVLRDEPGVFAAADSSAHTLADCEDTTIATALGVPCGSFGAQCGGECPDGDVCALDLLYEECSCFSPSEPCGNSTGQFCGGACPIGETCFALEFLLGCTCSPVGQIPCGAPGGTYCPAGSSCQSIPSHAPDIIPALSRCIDDDAVCGEPAFGFCPPNFQCSGVGPPPDIEWICFP